MKMAFEKNKRAETIIYIVLWTMLFMAPVMSMSVRSAQTGIDFDWSEIFTVWKQYAVFFLVFLIHNHLMAPMLIYHQQKWRYLGLSVAIIVIFQVYQCNHRPDFRNRGPRPEMVKQFEHERPPLPPDFQEGDFEPGFQEGDFEPGEPPRDIEPFRPDGPRHEKGSRHEKGPRREGNQHPPLIFGQRDIVALIIVVLMLGMNLGIKLYFKQRNDQKHLKELERRNLEQQLEYLKYQINPHFFMNTLNNIHALVDIDPKEAKEAIVELSKMMRYILYEGEIERIPLAKEMEFIKNYVALMRLRYTEKVKITLRATPLPMSPDVIVAPLLLVPIIENAFKHGVSYQTESYIDVNTVLEKDNIKFTCQNSKRKSRPSTDVKEGGVGLANVRKRMALIYGDAAKMNIHESDDTYTIELIIPIERLKPELS